MKKQNYLILGFVVVAVIITIAVVLFNTPKINDSEITQITDSNSEVLLLNKVIQSQNRFSDCIDEVAKVYEEQGIKQLTPEIIEKTRRCKSSVSKEVTKISGDNYLVKYNQNMPEDCKSARTVSNLLNVEVNIHTKETAGNWQNGIVFSESAIQDIENSLEPKDCKAYADYIGSHGTLK
ncbi:hypothetical protein A2478_00005 [Candidatus Falkowbacteria bacterium RIFOXYC2_FULL_36_12]|uniref:Uncharacterized protein n=1 Tax=Candidatus Falkowbacteria bacterium RIFOXYC2_FULL_36_12 TaxID=1798002 RepID=A0A1F5T1H2_9BACT|nr:MAG: hypothetical protein A2478_00005 [Candidatus Falkowbacteria bacterium RIFOXYC2_FULL_36_12]